MRSAHRSTRTSTFPPGPSRTNLAENSSTDTPDDFLLTMAAGTPCLLIFTKRHAKKRQKKRKHARPQSHLQTQLPRFKKPFEALYSLWQNWHWLGRSCVSLSFGMQPAKKFDAESASIQKRFLEKLDGGGWEEFQRDGDDVILSRSFDDAPTPAFLARYTLVGQGGKSEKILRMMHEYAKRFEWDKDSLDPDSHLIEQITPTRSVDCSGAHSVLWCEFCPYACCVVR
jgi:hypothetical protein